MKTRGVVILFLRVLLGRGSELWLFEQVREYLGGDFRVVAVSIMV